MARLVCTQVELKHMLLLNIQHHIQCLSFWQDYLDESNRLYNNKLLKVEIRAYCRRAC